MQKNKKKEKFFKKFSKKTQKNEKKGNFFEKKTKKMKKIKKNWKKTQKMFVDL